MKIDFQPRWVPEKCTNIQNDLSKVVAVLTPFCDIAEAWDNIVMGGISFEILHTVMFKEVFYHHLSQHFNYLPNYQLKNEEILTSRNWSKFRLPCTTVM